MAKQNKEQELTQETFEETKTIDYTNILNKIFIALIVIIVMLGINTGLLLVSVGEFSSPEEETATTEYDVSMFKEINSGEYADLYKKDELAVTYFGRPTCGYCVQFLPTLQKAQKEYGYKTYYVDIDKVTQEDANKIFALNAQFNDTLGRTPMVTITKAGKLIDIQMGYSDYDTFAKFLTDNGVKK